MFTHDLDVFAMLAPSHAMEPSLLQVRTTDQLPCLQGDAPLTALRMDGDELSSGAMVVEDEKQE